MSSFVLLTGVPGCGKTTMIKRLVADLQKTPNIPKIHGFYTEEVRNGNNERIGFDVVTFDGKRGPLAKISSEITSLNRPASGLSCKVGSYLVFVREFENLYKSSIEPSNEAALLVIDEIGKMELFSESFTKLLNELLTSKKNFRVIATVPLKNTSNLVAELKSHSKSQLFHLTKSNRDEIYQNVLESVQQLVG